MTNLRAASDMTRLDGVRNEEVAIWTIWDSRDCSGCEL